MSSIKINDLNLAANPIADTYSREKFLTGYLASVSEDRERQLDQEEIAKKEYVSAKNGKINICHKIRFQYENAPKRELNSHVLIKA